MKAEYGVDLRMQQLPYEQLRFITKAPVADLKDLYLSTDAELLEDYRGRSLLVFASQWSINFILKRNPGLELAGDRAVIGYNKRTHSRALFLLFRYDK